MKAHAIMIALPYQGHLNPFVDLAMKLASEGITVTFVHTEHAHHQIARSQEIPTTAAAAGSSQDIFTAARASSSLDIRYATISDGFPLDFDRDLNFVDYWESLIRDFPSLVAEFVGNIIASSDPSPRFLVTDTFAAWPAMVAQKYNLVNVSFWTQPATEFAIDYHIHLLKENGHYPPQGMLLTRISKKVSENQIIELNQIKILNLVRSFGYTVWFGIFIKKSINSV